MSMLILLILILYSHIINHCKKIPQIFFIAIWHLNTACFMMWPMLRPHLNFIANLCSDSNLCTICGGLSLNPNQLRCIFKKMCFTMRQKMYTIIKMRCQMNFPFFPFARTLLFYSMINIPVFKIGITSSYPPTTYQI